MKWISVLEQDFDKPAHKAQAPKEEKTAEHAFGLSSAEAAKRLRQYGENRLLNQKKRSPAVLFFTQFKDVMTLILLVCTAVSLVMGEYVEAVTIAVIVLMNGILGFIQEYRTERTLESLKAMAAPTARVYRDGNVCETDAALLVPGDAVLLRAGSRVPADGVLLESAALSCDESMLTGESAAVQKAVNDEVSMGCSVTAGHGIFRVEHTGMNTRMGKIAHLLHDIAEEPTPLQKHLNGLSGYIAAGCLLICGVVSVTGILRGEALFDMLITGVSLAVAAVPEGLSAVVTISLALAVSRMVKQNALVRRLHAVETLGCASVICSDKTGTITQNKMTAVTIANILGEKPADAFKKEDPNDLMLAKCFATCTGGEPSPTEEALLSLAKPLCGGIPAYCRIAEEPFDSTRKRMSVLVRDESGSYTLFVKGAPDVLLKRCTGVYENGKTVPLSQGRRLYLERLNNEMADKALRVIGAAYREASSPGDTAEENLIFIGFAGLIDPPREGVKKAVSECRKGGIRTVMITGDHKRTAAAIAKQVGVLREGDRVLTGSELDGMDDAALREAVKQTAVFARVTPEHKLRIVRAFKQNGAITAMTGDGVNDAPAVKEADIGVSMGKSGTDVTKEASELILLDDDFSTLVRAAAQGRSIYRNIRKFIRYLLSCNIGEVLTMFLGMLFHMPVVLLPIQILLVNLVTDGLPAIALGLEPFEADVMKKPPRKPGESIFSNGLAAKIIVRGVFIGLATLASFTTAMHMTQNLTAARTAALFSLILAQLIHVFECKSEEKPLFRINLLNNKKLLGAAAVSLAVLLAVIYVPALQVIFDTCALGFDVLIWPIVYCFIAPLVLSFWRKR